MNSENGFISLHLQHCFIPATAMLLSLDVHRSFRRFAKPCAVVWFVISPFTFHPSKAVACRTGCVRTARSLGTPSGKEQDSRELESGVPIYLNQKTPYRNAGIST